MKSPAPDLLRSPALTKWWLPLLPACWASLFWRIGAQPIQNWDESRLAVNAAEMLRTHNWLVTTYRGQPDLWNTKPPLLVWLQALSLSLFGYSEWAFRLPTSLAALALVVVVAVFAKRWLGGPLAGLLAGLALLTSKGFVAGHVARTGDYEALLLLFTTSQVLAVFAWLQTRQRRFLFLAGATVGLAVLTKGIAGLLFLPGIGIEVIRRGRLVTLLRQPATWAAFVLAVGLPALWYAMREQAGPGYLVSVWQNELGGRLLNTLEQVPVPWYTYLLHFLTQQFLLWTPWVLLSGWALARRPAKRPPHRFLTLTAWTVGVFLFIISTAATKHTWYDAPVYPLLALLIGAGLTVVARLVAVRPGRRGPLCAAGLLLLAVVPSAIAMHSRLKKAYIHRYDEASLTYGRYLRDPAATPARRYAILHPAYNAPLEFYALAARHAQPADTVEVFYQTSGLRVGQVVLTCGDAGYKKLSLAYVTRVQYQADSCRTCVILSRRDQ